MPRYRVQSGDMDVELDTPAEAQAYELVVAALWLCRSKGPSLGMIAEVSGGQYLGDDISYCSVPCALEAMGLMVKD